MSALMSDQRGSGWEPFLASLARESPLLNVNGFVSLQHNPSSESLGTFVALEDLTLFGFIW